MAKAALSTILDELVIVWDGVLYGVGHLLDPRSGSAHRQRHAELAERRASATSSPHSTLHSAHNSSHDHSRRGSRRASGDEDYERERRHNRSGRGSDDDRRPGTGGSGAGTGRHGRSGRSSFDDERRPGSSRHQRSPRHSGEHLRPQVIEGRRASASSVHRGDRGHRASLDVPRLHEGGRRHSSGNARLVAGGGDDEYGGRRRELEGRRLSARSLRESEVEDAVPFR